MEYIGIFQGGGIKGIAHIGAYMALEENGFLCKKAAGTSVGAIIAGLVTAGYNGREMMDIINYLDLKSLIKNEPNKLKNFFNEKGLYSSSYLEKEIAMLLNNKGINTFQSLKVNNDYILKTVATKATRYQQIIFPDDLLQYQIKD